MNSGYVIALLIIAALINSATGAPQSTDQCAGELADTYATIGRQLVEANSMQSVEPLDSEPQSPSANNDDDTLRRGIEVVAQLAAQTDAPESSKRVASLMLVVNDIADKTINCSPSDDVPRAELGELVSHFEQLVRQMNLATSTSSASSSSASFNDKSSDSDIDKSQPRPTLTSLTPEAVHLRVAFELLHKLLDKATIACLSSREKKLTLIYGQLATQINFTELNPMLRLVDAALLRNKRTSSASAALDYRRRLQATLVRLLQKYSPSFEQTFCDLPASDDSIADLSTSNSNSNTAASRSFDERALRSTFNEHIVQRCARLVESLDTPLEAIAPAVRFASLPTNRELLVSSSKLSAFALNMASVLHNLSIARQVCSSDAIQDKLMELLLETVAAGCGDSLAAMSGSSFESRISSSPSSPLAGVSRASSFGSAVAGPSDESSVSAAKKLHLLLQERQAQSLLRKRPENDALGELVNQSGEAEALEGVEQVHNLIESKSLECNLREASLLRNGLAARNSNTRAELVAREHGLQCAPVHLKRLKGAKPLVERFEQVVKSLGDTTRKQIQRALVEEADRVEMRLGKSILPSSRRFDTNELYSKLVIPLASDFVGKLSGYIMAAELDFEKVSESLDREPNVFLSTPSSLLDWNKKPLDASGARRRFELSKRPPGDSKQKSGLEQFVDCYKSGRALYDFANNLLMMPQTNSLDKHSK